MAKANRKFGKFKNSGDIREKNKTSARQNKKLVQSK